MQDLGTLLVPLGERSMRAPLRGYFACSQTSAPSSQAPSTLSTPRIQQQAASQEATASLFPPGQTLGNDESSHHVDQPRQQAHMRGSTAGDSDMFYDAREARVSSLGCGSEEGSRRTSSSQLGTAHAQSLSTTIRQVAPGLDSELDSGLAKLDSLDQMLLGKPNPLFRSTARRSSSNVQLPASSGTPVVAERAGFDCVSPCSGRSTSVNEFLDDASAPLQSATPPGGGSGGEYSPNAALMATLPRGAALDMRSVRRNALYVKEVSPWMHLTQHVPPYHQRCSRRVSLN
jgi:hypothetical protein